MSSLPPIDASFSWSDQKGQSCVDPVLDAELAALHEELGVTRGAAITGVGTKPELAVPTPPLQTAESRTGSQLIPSMLLSSMIYEHRSSEISSGLYARLRDCHEQSGSDMFHGLCVSLLSTLPSGLNKNAAILVSTAEVGPPSSSASTGNASPSFIIWLLFCNTENQRECKQTFFALKGQGGESGSVPDAVFQQLTRWADCLALANITDN